MTLDSVKNRAPAPGVRIEFFDPHQASEPAWAAYQHYRRLRDRDRWPDLPLVSDADFAFAMRREEPLVQHHRWAVFAPDGTVVGHLLASLRRPGSPHAEKHRALADAGCYVLPAWRRRGIATRLLGTLRDFMAAQGRSLATVQAHDPAAQAWLSALGVAPRLATVQSRLALERVDEALLRRWREAPALALHGLRWEMHAGRVPLDRLTQLLPAFDRLFRDVPLGALEGPPVRFELEGFRSWYADLDRRGGAHHVALLLDAAGEVAALSIGIWEAHAPEVLWQQLTATDRRWRGQGLAKAVKAALLIDARRQHRGLRRVVTFNAASNAPMRTLNAQMGFEAYRHEAFYQVPCDAMSAWLAAPSQA